MTTPDAAVTVVIPDLGDTTSVQVVEVSVQVGDEIAADQTLLVLEGEKATMDVPSTHAGVVTEILVAEGDQVVSGQAIVELRGQASATEAEVVSDGEELTEETSMSDLATGSLIPVEIPDIGDSKDVTVIEIAVQVGDQVGADEGLLTLEGEKATMEVPCPYAGQVKEITVSVGDKVNGGDVVAMVHLTSPLPKNSAKPEPVAAKSSVSSSASSAGNQSPDSSVSSQPSTVAALLPVTEEPAQSPKSRQDDVYAGPVVRRLAREFGIDLSEICGTGRKSRVQKSDLQQYVRSQLQRAKQGGGSVGGLQVSDMPQIDFSRYGETVQQPLNKIKRWTAKNLHRNWVTIPHVTQFDRADISALEKHRNQYKDVAKALGVRLTPLVFVMKALVDTLKAFPNFNASLDASGESLIVKRYYHLGVAVDTPNGLVVPVIRDVDQKSVVQLAHELVAISQKARDVGLTPQEMQGGTMTISSLGGIGGEYFTPIINAPEVAILGVSKSSQQPHWDGQSWQPRLMLPLSLSYDHRVIDGAEGARFMVHLAERLASGMTDLQVAAALADWAKK